MLNLQHWLHAALIHILLPVAGTAAAALLTYALWPWMTNATLQIFVAAVVLAAWLGGLLPGIVTAVLSVIVVEYVFLNPTGRLAFFFDDIVRFTTFIAVAVLVSFLTARRRRAEQTAREQRERLRVAQRAANMGTWEWDIEKAQIYWSEEIPALHGLPPMQFSGDEKKWLEFAVYPDDRERVNAALQRALRGEADYEVEFRTQWPDGSIHWIGGRAQVFRDEKGRPVRMVGIAMDITARKLAEESLRLAEKLAATGRLAASISHEINNPLESVTNLLYLLQQHASLDESARQYARLAQDELGRVTHITKQTLAFFRDSAQPSEIEMDALVQSVLDLLAHRIQQRRLRVEQRVEGRPTLMGFASELRQVVSNLLVNALDAAPEGGRIVVHAAEAREWRPEGRRGVRLVIADNGAGIAPVHKGRVFEPFFTTKGERGTGLGLWVTHGIVRKHGGSIRAHSSTRPGRSGTCFSIFLPFEAAAKAEAKAAGDLALRAS